MKKMRPTLTKKSVLIVLWVFIIVNEAAPIPHTYTGNENDQNVKKDTTSEFKFTLIPGPERTRESVKLESEALPSRILSAYDKAQGKAVENADILPLIDTIREEDKYGNNGDQFDGISRSIINGYEAFSNFLNTVIEKPKEIFRSLSKGLTSQLDIVGGKLVGL